MTMNLPNKLTLFRVIMVPFFVYILLAPIYYPANSFLYLILPPAMVTYSNYIAAFIFVLASFTDFLDGYLARRDGLVTNFGKFMDPLADKLLVCSALICLIQSGQLPAWVVVIIIAREFIISGFRLIASDNGVVIAASYWGKFKTVTQMVMVVALLLNIQHPLFILFSNILIWLSVILTVVSLVDYVVKNIDVLKDQK